MHSCLITQGKQVLHSMHWSKVWNNNSLVKHGSWTIQLLSFRIRTRPVNCNWPLGSTLINFYLVLIYQRNHVIIIRIHRAPISQHRWNASQPLQATSDNRQYTDGKRKAFYNTHTSTESLSLSFVTPLSFTAEHNSNFLTITSQPNSSHAQEGFISSWTSVLAETKTTLRLIYGNHASSPRCVNGLYHGNHLVHFRPLVRVCIPAPLHHIC